VSPELIQVLSQFGFPAVFSVMLLVLLERKLNGLKDVPRKLDGIMDGLKSLTVEQSRAAVLLQQTCQGLTQLTVEQNRAAVLLSQTSQELPKLAAEHGRAVELLQRAAEDLPKVAKEQTKAVALLREATLALNSKKTRVARATE